MYGAVRKMSDVCFYFLFNGVDECLCVLDGRLSGWAMDEFMLNNLTN